MVEIKGGDKLQAELNKIMASVNNAASADIGFLENATYPDGTKVAFVAAMNEYGDGKRPPRPFFSTTVEKRGGAWGHNLGVALKKYNFNAAASLAIVGQGAKEDVEASIREFTSPPLAESTIARKSSGTVKKIKGVLGPAKPLIDTGHMLNSVSVRVKTGE
jgi:hypothetical protein